MSTSVSDLTGQKAAELAKQHKEELAARKDEISLIRQAAIDMSDEVIDIVENTPIPPKVVDDIEYTVVADESQTKVIRPLEDREQVTIGKWGPQDLVAGQRYEVPFNVWSHLNSLGILDPRV